LMTQLLPNGREQRRPGLAIWKRPTIRHGPHESVLDSLPIRLTTPRYPSYRSLPDKVVLASTSQEGNAMAEDQDLLTKLEYRIDSFLRLGRQEAPSSNK
jgi:hypothetical protein